MIQRYIAHQLEKKKINSGVNMLTYDKQLTDAVHM